MPQLVTRSDLLALRQDVLAVRQNLLGTVRKDLLAMEKNLQMQLELMTLRLTVRFGVMWVVGIGVLLAILKLT